MFFYIVSTPISTASGLPFTSVFLEELLLIFNQMLSNGSFGNCKDC